MFYKIIDVKQHWLDIGFLPSKRRRLPEALTIQKHHSDRGSKVNNRIKDVINLCNSLLHYADILLKIICHINVLRCACILKQICCMLKHTTDIWRQYLSLSCLVSVASAGRILDGGFMSALNHVMEQFDKTNVTFSWARTYLQRASLPNISSFLRGG